MRYLGRVPKIRTFLRTKADAMIRFTTLLLMAAGCTSPTPDLPSLVPLPASTTAGSEALEWPEHPVISGPDEASVSAVAGVLGGVPGEVGAVRLVHDDRPDEAYRMEISSEGAVISASSPAGFFYGAQTLLQVVEDGPSLPGLVVEDEPRFGYRGMHLDVGRHFFPVAFVKRYLDLMARFKFNRFHWHLTEDQGWRIEIKALPRLTDVGSRRVETILEKNFNPFVGDGTPHEGFYTQEEVREIVAYAAALHIEVIPEIEMPGHARAALAAYPELACTPGPFEVSTVWGIHDDVFCPSEETFAFLETVLREVIDLFPGEYIHIGADEVPKTRWRESPLAQEVIRREGLTDEDELQSWFVRRIEHFLNQNGKRLIGWDEILEGGLAPDATVMSWRGTDGGIAAARMGHDVIMSPVRFAYFDLYQGDPATEPIAADWPGHGLDLQTVYAFEPVPEELTPTEAKHVLGGQANVWTEYIKTPDKVEYMILPRMLAMAEVLWSPAARRDWISFQERLPSRLASLEADGFTYRPLD